MVPFYAACDVICVPSSSEPFGRTVIEAMAVGVPVVATRVGGIPEIVDCDDLGLLVDYGNREALRAAVAKLLRDRNLATRQSNAARQKASSEYRAQNYQKRVNALVAGIESSTHPHGRKFNDYKK